MSFGGPTPNTPPPSGPFEAALTSAASSPYAIAAAIFTLNMGSRFLPFEVTKGQEKFLNQPMIRRFVIFVIFFVATRNIVTAGWLAIVTIVCLGYLFNENSSLYIFGSTENHNYLNDYATNNANGTKGVGDSLALTPEEQQTLKILSEKSEKIRKAAEKPIELNGAKPKSKPHDKYQKTLENLWLI
jgi:hypothetical protein